MLRQLARLIMRQSDNAMAVETLQAVYRYLDNRRELIAYDAVIREDGCIGSGAVESAVNHVMQQRMKRSGMR
ncbi:MAG: hypothetical protein ACI9OJ_002858, partial [Myxococcota bacterium]